jgi:Glyoxalase superfamily protein
MANVSVLSAPPAIGERVGKAGPDLFRSSMKGALMRDFRDAKVMARALRDALKAKAIETTHAEALELIAKAFGYKNWHILSAKIEAAEPKPSDERWLSASGNAEPPKRRTQTRDRHGERADPSQITHFAVKDIGYEQRGFHWEKASIKVYLHGQSVDIAQGVFATAPIYTHHILKSEVWHAYPKGKFVIGELRHSWRGPLRLIAPFGPGKIVRCG